MADSSSSFTVLGALGFGSGLQVTVAGVILNQSTAPAATNAYVNYDGTNVVVNSPNGKGVAIASNGGNGFLFTTAGVLQMLGSSASVQFNGASASPFIKATSGSSFNQLSITSHVPDGSSAIGSIINNDVTLSTAGAKLLSVQNNGTEKAFIDLTGAYSPTSASSGASSNPFFGYNGTNVLINAPSSKAILGMVNSATFPFRGLAVAANDTTLDGQFEVSHLSGGSGAVVAGDPASAGRVTIGLGAGTTSSGTAVTASGSDLAMRVGCTVNSTGTVSQPILLGSWSHNFFSPPYITATPANAATAALAVATLPFLQTTVSGWSMIANATGIPAGSYVWYLGGIAQ